MARLRELAVETRAAAAEFEPELWSGAECAAVAEELAATAKACTAAAARAAARAVRCGVRKDGAEWLARASGSTPSEARTLLSTASGLAHCPATSEAVKSGAVSLTQAREITRAERAVPGSEAELLQVASTRGMAGLRDEVRRLVLASKDRKALHREQWQTRDMTHWVDELGMVAGRFRLPPEVGLPFVNRLDAETDRLRRAARRDGSTEPREAYAADAFLRMVSTGGAGKVDRADVVFVCSLDAYRRGDTEDDELCHVVGGGPVAVSVVREAVAEDAFVKAVIVHGTKIDTVAHFGRRMSTELRTALELGPPPTFEGAVCSEEGCDRRYGLEWDHVNPVANAGGSNYENLQALCAPHHWTKTEGDRKAGLLGGGRAPPVSR